MAARIADLNDGDLARRVWLREQLRAAREHAGLGQRDLAARLGIHQSGIARYERGEQWHITTVLRWARALQRRPLLHPVGFPAPRRSAYVGRNDRIELALHDLLGRASFDSPDVADAWAVANLQSQLGGIRCALGVTQARLARQLGVITQAVCKFEQAEDGTRLAMAQRYARALARVVDRPGAYLAVDLVDAEPQENSGC